jgi:hypothetical protein
MSDDVERQEADLERREAIVRAGLERVFGPENVLAVGEGFAIIEKGDKAVRYGVPALLDPTIPVEVGEVVELLPPPGAA